MLLLLLRTGTGGYGMSIDLDAFDSAEAPGVNVSVPGGFSAQDFCFALPLIKKDSHLLGIEIVEFNPVYDHDHLTEKLVFDLMTTCFDE